MPCNRLLIYFYIFTVVMFAGCSDDTGNSPVLPDDNFTYPFSLNSYWYYESKNFISNLRPDSIRIYFTQDTTEGYGGAIFISDTIIKQDTLRILRNNHSEPNHFHSSFEFYKQNDTGLIRYAHYTEGSNFGPYKPVNDILKFKFKNKVFNSTKEIFNFINNEHSVYEIKDTDTSLIYDNPPSVVLKYPIQKNYEWTVSQNSDLRITKKYIDFENILSGGNFYYCIKLRKNWYYNNSTLPDENIICYDYFSKQGMIKRSLLVSNIMIYNSTSQLIGFIDVKEEDNLIFYTP